jgi:hypothetical protein
MAALVSGSFGILLEKKEKRLIRSFCSKMEGWRLSGKGGLFGTKAQIEPAKKLEMIKTH